MDDELRLYADGNKHSEAGCLCVLSGLIKPPETDQDFPDLYNFYNEHCICTRNSRSIFIQLKLEGPSKAGA